MASYTVILLKKFAARPIGGGFFIAKGGGEKNRVAHIARMHSKVDARAHTVLSSERKALMETKHGGGPLEQASGTRR